MATEGSLSIARLVNYLGGKAILRSRLAALALPQDDRTGSLRSRFLS
jgi:hypothetical protein